MKLAALLLALLAPLSAAAQELVVGTLNVESAADTSPFAVGRVMDRAGFADVWALQEVESLETLTEYTVAAASIAGRASFPRVISESGEITAQHRKSDHLGLVYNSSRLRQVETVELHGLRSTPGPGRLGDADWSLRGALFLRLQDRRTGTEFYVGTVHLKCCGEGRETRAHQARILADWVEQQDVPVIIAGDVNIPVEPGETETDSEAFQTLLSTMTWMAPTNPVPTQCSPRFRSMLDHVFVHLGPNLEPIDATIAETEEVFCEAEVEGGPDHRPVLARFELRK